MSRATWLNLFAINNYQNIGFKDHRSLHLFWHRIGGYLGAILGPILGHKIDLKFPGDPQSRSRALYINWNSPVWDPPRADFWLLGPLLDPSSDPPGADLTLPGPSWDRFLHVILIGYGVGSASLWISF